LIDKNSNLKLIVKELVEKNWINDFFLSYNFFIFIN
jgi:hypothetical protein